MNTLIKNNKLLRFFLFPIIWSRRKIYERNRMSLGKSNPKELASILYKRVMKKDLDWNNPKDLNEKINWLKFNTDISVWSRLSDKYAVREYVRERGCEDLLVDIYGAWEKAEDIDFTNLPDRFVLKANNGCGTVLLVNDKNALSIRRVRRICKKWLKSKFGYYTAEIQYPPIKPMIIAEEYLVNDQSSSSSIVDYKVFCFDGNPYCVLVCANRIIGKKTEMTFYDLDWNKIPDMLDGTHKNNYVSIDKPKCLQELLHSASLLAQGHPEVRVDFYIVNNRVYFGEMTFTSLGGYMDYISPKYLEEMGNLVTLPSKTSKDT